MDELYRFLKSFNKYARNTDVMIAAALVGILGLVTFFAVLFRQ